MLDISHGVYYHVRAKCGADRRTKRENLRRIKMRRFLALLLALMMLMSLTACGGGSGDGKDNDDGGKAPTQTELPKVEHYKTYSMTTTISRSR